MPHPQFNALKHGCTARTPVLPGEDESLWREVEAQWFEDYEPRTHTSHTMVAEAAIAFWHLARNRNRLEKFERTLSPDVLTWTDADHNTFARFTRYQTAAQRAFSNAFKNLECLRKARIAEGTLKRDAELQLEKLQFQMACQTERLNIAAAKSQLDREKHEANQRHRAAQLELQKQAKATSSSSSSSSSTKKKKDTFEVAEQWLEITATDGLTKTEYIPTNEELLEELKKEGVIPKMVYRRMNFPNGIPPEYTWTNSHDPKTCPKTLAGEWCEPCAPYLYAGAGIQRMTFDTWQQIIQREALAPGQHAGPTGTGNLPRPKERGGDVSYDEMLEYLEDLDAPIPDERDEPGNGADEA